MNLTNIKTRDPELAGFLEESINGDESSKHAEYEWLVVDRLVHTPADFRTPILDFSFAKYRKKEDHYILEHKQNKSKSSPSVLCPEEIFQQSLKVGIRCINCKDKNVHYKNRARRRGDEPMVAECICRTCQHKFTLTS